MEAGMFAQSGFHLGMCMICNIKPTMDIDF